MAKTKSTISTVDDLYADIQKEFGKESVFVGNDYHGYSVQRWDISSPLISHVLGGGLPKGRIIEIYGPESSGKTSLACYLAGEVQKQDDRVVAYIDAEHGADLDYAKTMGLDSDKVLFSQPDSGEEALGIAEREINSGLVSVIIIDSVAALTPQAEIDGEIGDQQMGLLARLMSKSMRRIRAACGRNNCTMLFINQIREKIGVMFGNPEITTGGRALRFYASTRLEVRRVEFLTKGTESPHGLVTRITAKKNKTAPPMRKGEIKIVFGKGIQFLEEYVDFGVEYGIVEKSGAWYTYKGERGQGKENFVDLLQLTPELSEKLMTAVNKVMSPSLKEEKEQKYTPPKRETKKKTSKKEESIELNVKEK